MAMSTLSILELLRSTDRELGRPKICDFRNRGLITQDRCIVQRGHTPFPDGEWRHYTANRAITRAELLLQQNTPARLVDLMQRVRTEVMEGMIAGIENEIPPNQPDWRLVILDGAWMTTTVTQQRYEVYVLHIDATFAFCRLSDYTFEPHRLDDLTGCCGKCGVTWAELIPEEMPTYRLTDGIYAPDLNRIEDRGCVGELYTTRIGVKLFDILGYRMDLDHEWLGVRSARGRRVWRWRNLRPWQLRRKDFARLVTQVIKPWSSSTAEALIRGLEADPTACPILADALEEAGCDDANLLTALRTP